MNKDLMQEGNDRFNETKTYFMERGKEISDDVALGILGLLTKETLEDNKSFRDMIEFAFRVWLLKQGYIESTIMDKDLDLFDWSKYTDYSTTYIKNAIKGLKVDEEGNPITYHESGGEKVSTFGDLCNFLSHKNGPKYFLRVPGISRKTLNALIGVLQSIDEVPINVLENINNIYSLRFYRRVYLPAMRESLKTVGFQVQSVYAKTMKSPRIGHALPYSISCKI